MSFFSFLNTATKSPSDGAASNDQSSMFGGMNIQPQEESPAPSSEASSFSFMTPAQPALAETQSSGFSFLASSTSEPQPAPEAESIKLFKASSAKNVKKKKRAPRVGFAREDDPEEEEEKPEPLAQPVDRNLTLPSRAEGTTTAESHLPPDEHPETPKSSFSFLVPEPPISPPSPPPEPVQLSMIQPPARSPTPPPTLSSFEESLSSPPISNISAPGNPESRRELALQDPRATLDSNRVDSRTSSLPGFSDNSLNKHDEGNVQTFLTNLIGESKKLIEVQQANFTKLRKLKLNIEKNDSETHKIMSGIQECEVEQQLLAAQEEFDKADLLNAEIEQLKLTLENKKCSIQEDKLRLQQLDAAIKSNRSEQSLLVSRFLTSASGSLDFFQSQIQELQASIDENESMEWTRLQSEEERVSMELKHIEKEEDALNEESSYTEDAIKTQSGDLIYQKTVLEDRQRLVEMEIFELEKTLAQKKNEEKKIKSELDQIDSRVQEVRKKYDRQLQRLQIRRDSLEKTKEECVHEMSLLKREQDNYSSVKRSLENKIETLVQFRDQVQADVKIGESFLESIAIIKDEGMSSDLTSQENSNLDEFYRAVAVAEQNLAAATNSLNSLKDSVACSIREINEIDEKIPKLEVEKKSYANAKRFKEASQVSKDIKTLQTQRDDIEQDITQKGMDISRIEGSINELNESYARSLSDLKEAQKQGDIERLASLIDKKRFLLSCIDRLSEIANNSEKELPEFSIFKIGIDSFSIEVDYFTREINQIREKHNLPEPPPAPPAAPVATLVPSLETENPEPDSETQPAVPEAEPLVVEDAPADPEVDGVGNDDVGNGSALDGIEANATVDIEAIRAQIDALEIELQAATENEDYDAADVIFQQIEELQKQISSE